MTFTAWTNGEKGFGFKVSVEDRDKYFSKENKVITIQLPENNTFINIHCNTDKKTFWNKTCKELISKEIGTWLQKSNYYPWEKGKPPRFSAEKMNNNTYRIISII